MEFNEENILSQMGEALEKEGSINEDEIEDLEIGRSHLSDFDVDAMTVSLGSTEWIVVEDDDDAEKLAIAVVSQDLEHEPEIFDQDWLASHVDQDALEAWVKEVAYDDDYARDIGAERFWEEAEDRGLEVPEFEEDEDGDEIIPEPTESDIDEFATDMAEDAAKDPMVWLQDIYGSEATTKAMEVAGFDIEAAAEDAVNTDGWQHFLSRYDGNSYETNEGFVYWRDN